MNKKTKIGLVLLIALAFVMPTVPLSADESTGTEADVQATSPIMTTGTTTVMKSGLTNLDSSAPTMAPLDYVGGWPVAVNNIFMDPYISTGDYDICAEFIRPDYLDCNEATFEDAVPEVVDGSYDLSPLTIHVYADCEYVTITFTVPGPEYLTDAFVQCGAVDVTSYGVQVSNFEWVFELPRTILPDGACKQNGFLLTYSMQNNVPGYYIENSGTISKAAIKNVIAFDCGPIWIKKFYEIYEWKLINEGDPINETEIYCTDFEDPCDFYDEWATWDMLDGTYNGAIDTWVWTDKRYNSPGHSFHSTALDTYLPNQYDILELNMNGAGVDVSTFAGEQIRLTFSHWMEGDAIVINGTTFIQDGGQVIVDFDMGTDWSSEVFYDNDWTDEDFVIDVPATATSMIVQFVFWSDHAFCYEGWYIDDVCISGIIGGSDDFYDWVFVTDGHTQEQMMEGQYLEECFDEVWHATEGEYKICVWLQTLDDCHRAVNGSGIPGFADSGPFCIEVTVADELCLAEIDLYMDPASPAWEGDDVSVFSVVENIGTLDAEDVQVQVTVNRGIINTVYIDDVEGKTIDDYTKYAFGGNDPSYNFWHVTDVDANSGTQSIAFFDPLTMTYPDCVCRDCLPGYSMGDYDAGANIAVGIENETLSVDDWGLQPTVRAKAKYVLSLDGYQDWFTFGIYDPSTGYTYSYSPGYPGAAEVSEVFWTGVEDSFTTIEMDLTDLMTNMQTYVPTYFDGDDLLVSVMFYSDDAVNTVPGYTWSGVFLDDIEILKIEADEEIIFQETQIIDLLNVSDTTTLEFIWEDAGVGNYVITQEILTEDCDPADNKLLAPYRVINYMQDMSEDGIIETVDLTFQAPGHWVIADCCDESIWCGDLETTMYGNNWNDVLYIAPDQNKTLVGAGGQNLVIDTWYQFNDSDEGIVEYSFDGQHWYTLQTYTGACDTDQGDMNPITDTIALPADTEQVRFRFVSDDTLTNRGWFISDVFIAGVIDDDCTSMDNFISEVFSYGDWWQDSWVYDYFVHELGYLPDFVGYGPDAFGDSWGCYDPLIWDVATDWIGFYPDNINNALDWTFPIESVFFGWLDVTTYYDLGTNDTGYVEIWNGADWDALYIEGGSLNEDYFGGALSGGTVVANDLIYWGGGTPLLTDYCDDDEITVRLRLESLPPDNSHMMAGYGIITPMIFYGMMDTNAPTTTCMLQGTFDDVYDYYTSEVAVTLTASDDVTGVAAIYYELDGVQYEYTRPFIIDGDGEHTLCYWSVDVEGNVEEKKCVAPFRIDETGPSIEITGPEPGIHILGRKLLDSDKYVFLFGGFEVTATVDVDDAPLATVEFYLNGELIGEDTTAPFSLRISEKNNGPATIKVVAKDVLGEDDEDTLEIDNYIKLF